jgi:hypothetical protein
MKKKARWPRVLLWIGCVLILFGIGGWFAANYAIDKVLDSLAENALEEMESSLDEIESEVPDPGSTGEAGSEQGADSAAASDPEGNSPSDGGSAPSTGEPASSAKPDDRPTDSAAGTDAANPNPSTDSKDTSGGSKSASDPGPSGNASSGSTQPAEQEDSASNTGGKDKPSASLDYSAQVSTDKMAAVRDNISTKERARVLAILLAKLDLSDIKTMQKLASGGLSVAEKRKARDLMLEKLTPEEYNELIQIAKKYGLSQGKTYEQVVKNQKKS